MRDEVAVILTMRKFEADALRKRLDDCGPGVEPRIAIHVIDAQGHDVKPRLVAGVATHGGMSDLLANASEDGRDYERGTTRAGMDCASDRRHNPGPKGKVGWIAAGRHRVGVVRRAG